MDDFFTDKTDAPVVEPEVESKIKVGEAEYSQDELNKLVDLGKIGLEAESKYKTRIDKVWPKFQQTINENREFREQQAKRDAEKANPPVPPTQQELSREQVRSEAIRQAKDLGLVTKDEFDQAVSAKVVQITQGQRLLDDIGQVIDTMSADGLPTTTTEDVIQHMQETGIRNPTKAYKDMFEREWIQNQTTKLNSIKSAGIPAVKQSVAGGKIPPSIRITKDNLEKLTSEALSGNYE